MGDLGPDGLRFVQYRKDCHNGEWWIEEDAFLIYDALMRLNNKMRAENGSNARAIAAWRAANPEKARARNAAYRAANPEKVKAKDAAYRAANLEKVKAKDAAYGAANPDKINAKTARRRAAKIAATDATANHAIIQTFYTTAQRLSGIIGVPFHVDHMIPLTANGGGGLHHHTNLRYIPAVFNLRRNAASFKEPDCWTPPFLA